MDLLISTPYRAGSIVNIARGAADAGVLRRFYTTVYLRRYHEFAQSIPLVGAPVARKLSRRSFLGVPREIVASESTLPELAHLLFRRMSGKLFPQHAAASMYHSKLLFDMAVAKCVEEEEPGVFLGMHAASENSFQAMQRNGGQTVLNLVNSHPTEQNRHLRELAGLTPPHHEFIPDGVVERVEREIELADRILVPSWFVAKQLLAHGIPDRKIVVVPYGVDLTVFRELARPVSRRKELQCLYVGQISHRKGLRTLVDTARRCRNLPIRFDLVGPMVSPEVLHDAPPNCHYLGFTPPGGDVADAMCAADIFVHPTYDDSWSLVVLEAMACGLPVITTNHAGSSEVIENRQTGIVVPPGDTFRFTDALRELSEDQGLRQRLGRQARQAVKADYSWPVYAERVLGAACQF